MVGLVLAAPLFLAGAKAHSVFGVLEIALSQQEKPGFRLLHRLPFCAITFGHVVIGLTEHNLEHLRAHEHEHVRQYERWGLFFFFAYPASSLYQWMRGNNPYWDNHEVGIYVDIIDGTPLFSSLDKYDSDTGWPTFARPINSNNIFRQVDTSGGIIRTEIQSKRSNSHLGHLFDDGPVKYNGVRYCMNSAALRFIPLSKMKSE